MDTLEKSMYIITLFDVYQGLLTDKQRVYMTDYYYDDLSLQEIAENHQVSRNAVYDQINKTVHKLETYESVLKLCEKQVKQKQIFEKLDKMELPKEVRKLIEALKKVE
ncbi:MAG: YlxM family DNA-binding protein [Candidatus Izemoplasmataceae bacterium]